MMAKECRVPVVAACETYKFGERVVLDAVTGNELGDASSLLYGHRFTASTVGGRNASELASGSEEEEREKQYLTRHLSLVHLMYDLTPAALVTAVCTEVGFIPPSSVPTVITKPGEAGGF